MARGNLLSWILGQDTTPGVPNAQPHKAVTAKSVYGTGLVSVPVVSAQPYTTAILTNEPVGYTVPDITYVNGFAPPAPSIYAPVPSTSDVLGGGSGC